MDAVGLRAELEVQAALGQSEAKFNILLPRETFVEAADILIRQEREWVPPNSGESLYLRPLMIATEAALGVRPAKEYLFLLFGSPSGDYFPQGVKPISLWLCTDYVRAAPGGTGEAKCAGNYAASLVAQQKAMLAYLETISFLKEKITYLEMQMEACREAMQEQIGNIKM